MAEKGSVYPISKKSLEKHLQKVDEHIEWINRGNLTEKSDLFELVKGIGTSKNMMAKEVNESVESIRQGFALYYEMYAMLEDKIKEVNPNADETEKRLFLNSYSAFAASSFIEYKLDLLIGEEAPFEFKKEDFKEAEFDKSKDDTLNLILARYYGLVNIGKRNDKLEKGIDLPRWSFNFFKTLKESAAGKKAVFNPKLVDLVRDAQFRVADEFTITGFEVGHEEKIKEKVEFVPVEPYQVTGNELAKEEMLKDMDRIVFFDLIAKKNPIMAVGGLPPSVLYDGFPGTGKTKLFKMGLTRLDKRVNQLNEFWKRKNMILKWTQVIIDQGVKSEYYSLTGRQTKEKLAITRRPDGIYIAVIDDIDLVAKMSRDTTGGGSDNDLLFSLMQYLDGLNTVLIGNTQLWSATNDAVSMDPALRQRHIARYPVDGPQEWYDFSDIFSDEFKAELKLGILAVPLGKDYAPYEMRKRQTAHGTNKDQGLLEKLKGKVAKGITLRDIGEYCAEIKKKNPRFTGRATHAAAEAIRQVINDYDIPEEWYVKPEIFFDQEFSRRVEMLKELCRPVSGERILEEIERYASSEQRYATDKFEGDVGKYIHGTKVQIEAMKRLQQEGGRKE